MTRRAGLCRLFFCGLWFSSFSALAATMSLPLTREALTEITFKGRDPNKFQVDEGALRMEVASSASALLLPLATVTEVEGVEFLWESTADFKSSKAQLQSKSGDDAVLRVGLIAAGTPPMLPWLVPDWLKQAQKVLKNATANMVMLIPQTEFLEGEQWPSPFTSAIQNLAVASSPYVPTQAQGASLSNGSEPPKNNKKNASSLSRIMLKEKMKIAGLMIMADGDDRHLHFVTTLKALTLITKD